MKHKNFKTGITTEVQPPYPTPPSTRTNSNHNNKNTNTKRPNINSSSNSNSNQRNTTTTTTTTSATSTSKHQNIVFAGRIYHELLLKEHPVENNMLIAPLSIQMALSMLNNGARGDTRQQLNQVLFPNVQSPPVSVDEKMCDLICQLQQGGMNLANSVFCSNKFPLRDDFVHNLIHNYKVETPATATTTTSSKRTIGVDDGNNGSGDQQRQQQQQTKAVLNMDFLSHAEQCRHTINTMVENKTRGCIKDLIPQGFIDGNTLMVLVNCLYFRDKWQHLFKAHNTKQLPFHLFNGQQQQIAMMRRLKEKALYGDHSWFSSSLNKTVSFQSLKLRYDSGHFSMQFLLPVTHQDTNEESEENNTPERLRDLEIAVFEQFSSNNASSGWNTDTTFGEYGCSTHKLDKEQRLCELSTIQIPKFKIECGSIKMAEHVKNLGATDAFIREKANFEGVSDDALPLQLFISNIVHKTVIEVDEQGTTAAAATAVIARGRGRAPAPSSPLKTFIIDRPFMFLLKHERTNQVVFAGRVVRVP